MVSDDTDLYVGIDVGKLAHVASLLSSSLLSRYHSYARCPLLRFEQSRAGFESLLALLCRSTSPDHCHVLLEHTGHYGYALEQYLIEHGIAVYRVQAQSQKGRRRKNKSDKEDAQQMAVLLYNHLALHAPNADVTQRIARLVAPPPTIVKLRGLVQHRMELEREATRRKNKLIAITDELFPEFTLVYRDPVSASALSMREAFPLPQDIEKATPAALVATRPYTRPSKAALLRLQDLARATIGIKNLDRQKTLLLEQKQLIAEFRLLEAHREELETEIAAIIESSREGQILTSFPAVGAVFAAIILAAIGTVANFDGAAKLRSYCGWAERHAQTGETLDSSVLDRGGNHQLKRTIYLITLNAVKMDTPFRTLYERLVPLKCRYDERTKKYRGKMKVIGRVAGQMVKVMYTLLKRDHDLLAEMKAGEEPPSPEVYSATKHRVTGTRTPRSTAPVPGVETERQVVGGGD